MKKIATNEADGPKERQRFSAEQIPMKLRTIAVLLTCGKGLAMACK
jgi:hypothetical protein